MVACFCLTTVFVDTRLWKTKHSRKRFQNFRQSRVLLGTLSIDNEMHDDDVCNPRRIGTRVSFLARNRKVKQCVVLSRRRLLILRLVALAMAFINVRNLLLINHNDGFIDVDEFVLPYDLFASKNQSTFRLIRKRLLT